MSDRKPLIGLVPQVDRERMRVWLRMNYMSSVEYAGGMPMMLPMTTDEAQIDAIVASLDGVLFTGGVDLEPKLYGEAIMQECGEIEEQRDEMELLLLKAALKYDKAILGICRGCQTINVGLGGTLYQDLPTQKPSEIAHRQMISMEEPTHDVVLLEDSPLKRLLGKDRISVNTSHHQAVKDPAPGVQAMAKASDGVIESICVPERKFVWGMQWHPEFMGTVSPDGIAIFKAFVDAAKG